MTNARLYGRKCLEIYDFHKQKFHTKTVKECIGMVMETCSKEGENWENIKIYGKRAVQLGIRCDDINFILGVSLELSKLALSRARCIEAARYIELALPYFSGDKEVSSNLYFRIAQIQREHACYIYGKNYDTSYSAVLYKKALLNIDKSISFSNQIKSSFGEAERKVMQLKEKCVTCHFMYSKGLSKMPPKNGDQRQAHEIIQDQIVQRIWDQYTMVMDTIDLENEETKLAFKIPISYKKENIKIAIEGFFNIKLPSIEGNNDRYIIRLPVALVARCFKKYENVDDRRASKNRSLGV